MKINSMLVFNFGPFLEGGLPVIEDVADNVQYANYGMTVSQQLCRKNSFGQIIVSFNSNFSSFAFIEVPDIAYFISKNVDGKTCQEENYVVKQMT